MKAKLLFAGVAMVAALASCSKENSSTPEVGTFDATKAYAKINISMGNVGTRASYSKGSPEEKNINSVMLVVYGNDNSVVGYGAIGDLGSATSGQNGVDDEYDSQLVELDIVGNKSQAATVVAYVNVPSDEIMDYSAAYNNLYKSDIIGVSNNFAMTNSGYFDDEDNWVVATPIVEGSLYNSKEAAEADASGTATTIYVERLAAKVTTVMTAEEPDRTADVKILGYVPEGSEEEAPEYSLVFDDINWIASGTANEMHLLKNEWTEDDLFSSADDANDAEKFRSYWAAGAYYADAYDAMQKNLSYASFNKIGNDGQAFGASSDNVTYSYIPEHTYGEDVISNTNYNVIGAATGIMALGKYMIKSNGVATEHFNISSTLEGNETTVDFYLLATTEKGVYTIFTADELAEYIFTKSKGKYYVGANAESVEELTKDNYTSKVGLTWDSATKKYTLTPSEEGNNIFVDGTDGKVKGSFVSSNARHYNEGYAYFFAPIEHRNIDGVGKYGVVRNHIYNLTVATIKGLGTPLDDDHFGPDGEDDPKDEPIVPDPETIALLRAEIKVLAWSNVDQTVNW